MQQKISQDNVSVMFNEISSKYDRVNRILSFGMDRVWRKKMQCFLPQGKELSLIDLATGTADQLLILMKTNRFAYGLGLDLAEDMLKIGQKKIAHSLLEKKIDLKLASALQVPSENDSFDCATISFGIRNMEDPLGALNEIRRILSSKGRVLILEFSMPKFRFFRVFYLFYLRKLLPVLGGWLSGKKDAYKYLNQSIEAFLDQKSFLALMKEAGFQNVHAKSLTFGIATIYIGDMV